MKSRFGTLSLSATSAVSQNAISVSLRIDQLGGLPGRVTLRVPHPEGKRARSVSEGVYHPEAETIELPAFCGEKTVTLWF